MIGYEIKADLSQLQDAISLFEFVGGNAADAQRIAINKAAPKIKTRSSQEIRSQVRLKAAYVNERLTFTRATRSNLVGKILAPSRGLRLAHYVTDTQAANDSVRWLRPPPEPARGIRVKVKPSGPTKQVTGGATAASKPFYLVLRNSRALGIAVRRRDGSLDVLFGASLSQVFAGVKDDLTADAATEYQNQLLDAMRYLLAKRYPPEA